MQKKFPDITIEKVSQSVFKVLELTGCNEIFSINVVTDDVSTYLEMSFKNFLTSKAIHSADKIFIVDEYTNYTWSEIEICATIIAEDLSRLGVTSGSRVGICSINSANWILTFFAIQKLEAIAVLMNFNMHISEIVTTAKIGDVDFLCYGDLPEIKDEQKFLNDIRTADSLVKNFYSIRSTIDFKARCAEYEPLLYKFANFYEADAPPAL